MSTINGRDSKGNSWTGNRTRTHIDWSSSNGYSGTETVELLGRGRMRGISATGDCKPCDYDGSRWSGRGKCPDGTYTESGNYDN